MLEKRSAARYMRERSKGNRGDCG